MTTKVMIKYDEKEVMIRFDENDSRKENFTIT